ncbi:hypothetical protein AbraIFM66951_000579 [Aspergillus brasiliensis]|uniref:Uncharacterized protein n=2 Tax=Aspergillus brasiliensis TaxID=319629 RepID=A0A1L9UUS6_ASPBC|nr:hypothetical protein ASPBRDRAFT_40618 [Aspergillus brasiliensis CBS 101740]GKZ25234.1 hypothetical protein AbraCBS73388_000693 [Aspergillus brasiliensis]GKZ48509.1 hypothetical protein AbraIFM66951_000579 [Aspergillus brasiliensis]
MPPPPPIAPSNNNAGAAIVDETLSEITNAANSIPLRKLLQSHLTVHCGIEKIEAYQKSGDKYKRWMVSYLAQSMAIEMFERLGPALAEELKKIP